MKLPVSVRVLAPGDAAAYLVLRGEASHDPGFGVSPQVARTLTPSMIAQSLMPSTTSLIYGALIEESLVGMVGFGGNSDGQATLFGLYVRPEYRRQSVGRTLTRHVVAAAADAGYELVKLTVRRDNAGAIGLYVSMGFVPWLADAETFTMMLDTS